MDGLDGLMLRKARAVLQRCVAHRTSSVDWHGSSRFARSIKLGRADVGWLDRRHATRGSTAGPLNAESPPIGGLSAIRRSGGFRGKGTFRWRSRPLIALAI